MKGDLDKALKLDPKQPQAYLLLAQLNLLPGGDGTQRRARGRRQGDRIGPRKPGGEGQGIAPPQSLQEKPEAKMADYDEAVRLMPDDAATVRARGLALADMEKYEKALVDLDKAISLAPEDGPTYEAKAIVFLG